MSSNEPLNKNICFICSKSNNLVSADICCKVLQFHTVCMNEYCSKSNIIMCPTCKKDITDKFSTTSVRVTQRIINWGNVLFYGGIISFIAFIVAGFTMYAQLKPHSGFIAMYTITYLWSLMISWFTMLILYKLNESIMNNNSEVNVFTKMLFWGNMLGSPLIANIVLLILSTISYYHPTLLSVSNVTIVGMIICSIMPSIDIVIGIIIGIIQITNFISTYCTMNSLTKKATVTEKTFAVRDKFVVDSV